MQKKYESRSTITKSKLVRVGQDDIKDGIFNCPDEVKIIGEKAFDAYSELITVANLNKVKRIEKKAFKKCANLTTVNAPEVQFIDREGFYLCLKLITVDLPQVRTIAEDAFSHCAALIKVNIPQAVIIRNTAFYFCINLATIDLPKVITIGPSAFHQCVTMTTINVPQLENLGSGAFSGCEKLVTLNISKVKAIKDYTFDDCIQLTTLILNPLIKLDFDKNNPRISKLQCENLQQVIINNLKNNAFDENLFISHLLPHLKKIKIILASKLIEDLCCIQKILKQNIAVPDIEAHISSFYSQLLFFSKSAQKPSTLSATFFAGLSLLL